MRILAVLVILAMSSCASEQIAPSKPAETPANEEPSLEEMSAQPVIACEANFAARSEVRVRHIAVEAFQSDTPSVKAATPEELRAAYKKLQLAHMELIEGEPIEVVWSRYSDPQTSGGNPDGDIGYFKRGELVPQFERVAFCIPAGEVSPVFRTVFGFHVLQITDVRY